jgi:iron complex outermembrane recepter protein
MVIIGCLHAPPGAAGCKLEGHPLQVPIPSQAVRDALNEFSEQTQVHWVSAPEADYVADAVPRSRRVDAGAAPKQALKELLTGTGVEFKCAGDRRTIIVSFPQHPPPPPAPCCDNVVSLPELRVKGSRLVTGPENQIVAPPHKTFTSEDEIAGIHDILQMTRSTPATDFTSLSSVSSSPYTYLTIYGVFDRHGNTTGVWQDDIPLPAATSNTFARGIPVLFDTVSQPQWGPQPVLLGANAQSGAFQYNSIPPSLKGMDYSGQLYSEWATTRGGDPTGQLSAAFGGPVMPNVLGFRVSGSYRSAGGFVDRVNQFTGSLEDANADRVISKSARLALSWQPRGDDSLSLEPAFFYQSTAGRDSPAFMIFESPNPRGGSLSDPAAGRFYNGSLIAQPMQDHFDLASLHAKLKFATMTLESITGFDHRVGSMRSEDSESSRWRCAVPAHPDATCTYPPDANAPITTDVVLPQRMFSQQLQLRSGRSDGQGLSWLIGAFFSDTRTRETDRVFAPVVPDVYLPLGISVFDWRVSTITVQRELAGFAQVGRSWWGGRITAGTGLRIERQQLHAAAALPTDGSIPAYITAVRMHLPFDQHYAGTVVAPQFELSYRPGGSQQDGGDGKRSQEYYLITATGYAPGNVDAARPTCAEPPIRYPSDTLWSMQLGTRQSWHSGSTLEFNLFQLMWDNGPTAWRTCLFMHLPGKALSRGLRLDARLPVGERFAARLEASYMDARYRQTIRNNTAGRVIDTGVPVGPNLDDNSNLIVRKGDALGTPPQVISPWNLTATLETRLHPAGRELTFRLVDTWRSRNPGPFYTDDPQAQYPGNLKPDPANNLLEARAILKFKQVKLELFVENVLDARPVLSKRNKGNDTNTLLYATTFRPRTIGVAVNWDF